VQPARRLPTILLIAGAAVLLIAVAIGERMGSRVIGQATEENLQAVAPAVSPPPDSSPQPYGPDWKRTQSLSAGGDPRFPDPRVPPQPLPTLAPPPKPRPQPPTPVPVPTPTYNPNVPIWRQKPLPTMPPQANPRQPGSPLPSGVTPVPASPAPP
jgi:hypothetical protein